MVENDLLCTIEIEGVLNPVYVRSKYTGILLKREPRLESGSQVRLLLFISHS